MNHAFVMEVRHYNDAMVQENWVEYQDEESVNNTCHDGMGETIIIHNVQCVHATGVAVCVACSKCLYTAECLS